jgi:hypothetical protein
MREAEKTIEVVGKDWEWKAVKDPDMPEDQRELLKFYRAHIYDFVLTPSYGYAELYRGGAHELFLSILQQLDLPPTLRKKVETCAKFFSKSMAQKPKKENAISVYEKALAAYRSHLAIAKEALKVGVPRGTGTAGNDKGSKVIQAGPFQVVNTGGFDDAVMAEASQVIETAARLLQAKGLDKVCYGEVLISNTLSRANVLAFYLIEKDEMFVRANLKGKKNAAVETVVHELGHRLHYKFLKSKDRDIRTIYLKLGMKDRDREREMIQDPALRPQPGETLVLKGKEYTVDQVVYDTVHLVRKPDSGGTFGVKARMPLTSWIAAKGLDTKKHPSTFVSNYAKTSHGENFAEMIAAYCLDKLPDDQIQMLKEII